jgi:NADH-quinone oxidoreductase subunit L
MFFLCSFGLISLSFYYLFLHAFSKCLLFLTAGAVIHNTQDQNVIKNNFMDNYLTEVAWYVGCLTLFGLPFLGHLWLKNYL